MTQWFRDTTNEFFNLTTSIKDNVQKVEFESGRTKTWLKSQTLKKTHSVSFRLNGRNEEISFWDWYEENAKCGSETIQLTNLVTAEGTKEYLMTSNPIVSGSHYPKTITINLVEV